MRNVHPSGEFPDLFLDRLKAIIKLENNPLVIESFRRQKVCSVRVNTIKTSTDKAIEYFSNSSLSFQKISWSSEVFIFNDVDPSEVSRLDWVSQGNLYIQGLSSMLPVIVLDPKPGERVLDLCAAPGSKTTQIAALMNNEGEIVAIDSVRPRFYRLKAVLALNGVEMARPKCLDGAKYRSSELFDRILVDAPCSSEARFKMSDAKTFGYWSLRKIKEMAHKQKGLLLNACRLLKPGGTLVYSTCTF
ncbi:MAG: RsmB/NOP family class I SAM-dependent RNA methyltransferase, partial [Candidatus Omnitrophica bacterium]|nr:RsmB/NOP family class I SAM-dependent RNA methyltransferase [Candidatus Omnitrophota bacterium]